MNKETVSESAVIEHAISLLRQRRFAEAEIVVDPLLKSADSAGARHVRAECRIARGALDDAAGDLDAALALRPLLPGLWLSRADLELWRDGLDGWERFIDRAIALPALPPAYFHFLARKACLLWMRRQTSHCAAVIGHLTHTLQREGGDLAQQLRGYTMSLAGQIHGLVVAERAGRGGSDAGEDLPKLYLVGDSHCIAPAGTAVNVDGLLHCIISIYVLGCKAWHLTTDFANPYKECAIRAARRIPAGSHVIFTAGDIDCRFESGFHNVQRKTGAPIDQAIDRTASLYLDRLCELFPNERYRLSVLAPPAQRGDLRPLSDTDRTAIAEIGRLFNHALRVGCAIRGLPFIDYYAMTVGRDGFATPALHVDGHHLTADALRLALIRAKLA